jgi:hypothetical protein
VILFSLAGSLRALASHFHDVVGFVAMHKCLTSINDAARSDPILRPVSFGSKRLDEETVCGSAFDGVSRSARQE